MKKYAFLLCLLICVVAVVGCGKNKRLVGKVTFDDGEPAPNGMVIFRTDTFVSKGEIQPNGSYKMGSEKENNGIPPGEYQVFVTGISGPLPPGVFGPPPPLCDPKYENPDTSGLTCKIPAPGNKFDFVVERRKN